MRRTMLATRGRAPVVCGLPAGMRIRWGNVGRAAVVVGVLALAVAWPRLAPETPRLPPDEGIPLASPSPDAGRPAAGEANLQPRPPATRPRRAKAKAPRTKTRKRPARAVTRRERPVTGVKRRAPPAQRPLQGPAAGTPRPSAPKIVRRAPAPTFSPQDPATQEFSFETG